MIVALLLLIVFILLFGAGVVKGWLTNIFGYGLGGLVFLVIIVDLGSYFGEYGPIWVVAVLGVLFGLTRILASILEARSLRQMDGPNRTMLMQQSTGEAAYVVWGRYVGAIREQFDPEAQNRARAFYEAQDGAGLERYCIAEMKRIALQKANNLPS